MFFDSSKTGRRIVGGVVLAALAAAGCGRPPAAGPETGRLPRVVCTTTVVADLVRQVADDRVAVDCLMPPGVDPHSYRATPRDADRLAGADLVVTSGLRLEGRIADLLARLGTRVPVVAVADALPRDGLLATSADSFDPHVWFDAALWGRCAPVVAEALARIDPEAAADHRSRAEAYARRLAAVDADVRARIATIPASRRVLVTAHDAFRYFGRAYGLEVVGVQGTSTESETGLGDLNGLVDLLVDRRIPAVFTETSVSDRTVTALIEGAASRGHSVALGGQLYSDSLGGPGSGAETLEAALEANVATIVAGLGTAAPRAGAEAAP
jgi:manganese/zinc/iron transport system substrate-binding protein